jgi:hypothetical protein
MVVGPDTGRPVVLASGLDGRRVECVHLGAVWSEQSWSAIDSELSIFPCFQGHCLEISQDGEKGR